MPELFETLLTYDIGAAAVTIYILWKNNSRLKELLDECREEKDTLHKQFQEYTEEQAAIWRELSTTVKEARRLRGDNDA